MHSGALILLSMALLMAAAALGLWLFIGQQQRRKAMLNHVQEHLNKSAASSSAAGAFKNGAALSAGWDASGEDTSLIPQEKASGLPVPAFLLGTVSWHLFYGAFALIGVVFLAVGLRAGWLAGAAILVVMLIACFFFLMTRVQKYRVQLTRQLPGFLDSMVRLVTLGNSVQGAFQMAAMTAKQPLLNVVERAASLARAGMDLEKAVAHVARQTRLDELHLLAAILHISVRYGGRVDVLLERVAGFMRDREQAEQELSAMTSETRMSAWVLSLLPVVVCGLIISFNAGYFLKMWEDPSGRNIIWAAAGLQVFGVVLLYRMAKLDDGAV